MSDLDLQRDTLHRLLISYPRGLLVYTHTVDDNMLSPLRTVDDNMLSPAHALTNNAYNENVDHTLTEDRGWDLEGLSLNPSLPFQYVKDNLHLAWNWNYLIDKCLDMTYQDLMDHKSYWENLEFIWEIIAWSRLICIELIEYFISNIRISDESKREFWAGISCYCELTLEMMILYRDNFHWPDILDHSDKIDLEMIYSDEWYDFFHVEYPRRYGESFIKALCGNQSITFSDEFIEEHQEEIDWNEFVLRRDITIQLIEKYHHKLTKYGWKNLCIRPAWLSEDQECIDFINRHVDDFYWFYLSQSLVNYPAIVEEFKNLVNWESFGQRDHYTFNQLSEYRDLLSDDRFFTLAISKCLPELDLEMLSNWPLTRDHWKILSMRKEITPEILGKFKDKLSYKSLSDNPSVPYEFILSNPEREWDSTRLSRRTYMPSTRGRQTKSAAKRQLG